jgi:hypothetical protein
MIEDIVKRLRNRLFWSDAEEAITEIETLRQMVRNWEETARMLAMDLGNPEYADEVYEDIRDGLYEKVRARLYRETEEGVNYE